MLGKLVGMNVDPVAALDDALKTHGLFTNRTSQGIAIQGLDPLIVSAAIVRVEEHSNARIVQLDVRVRSPRLANGWLIKSFGGVRPDECNAFEEAFGKFLRSSIHVLLALLVDPKYGRDQVEWQSWSLQDKRWRVCMDHFFTEQRHPKLDVGCHCLRVYCMLNERDCVGSEALLDNIDWPEGREIVSDWQWPERMFWARHFLMLNPDTHPS